MQTIKLLRPGNDPQSTHRTAADFEEVSSEIAYLSVG
jgi:hypothetical protein